jgi:prolipoprotein diacylglyceryltransferase
MKTKSLILESLLIILPLIGAVVLAKIGLDTNKPPESIMTVCFMFLPAAISYWVIKNKIQSSNHSNPEKIIRIWQYLILYFYISCITFLVLVALDIAEKSIRDTGMLWLTWMIVYGNFRFKIEPYYEPIFDYFSLCEDIQKRVKRFSGKLIFFGGLLSFVFLLVLSESLAGYILIFYLVLFCIAPLFYAKILQSNKVA